MRQLWNRLAEEIKKEIVFLAIALASVFSILILQYFFGSLKTSLGFTILVLFLLLWIAHDFWMVIAVKNKLTEEDITVFKIGCVVVLVILTIFLLAFILIKYAKGMVVIICILTILLLSFVARRLL